MTPAEFGTTIAGATAVAGFLTAVLGILRYFNYRTRRDRVAAVGAALDAVVAALAADNDVQRAAAAIRLRRFFDRRSEVGVAGAAYAADALNVMAAVLREVPAGNVQKLLADGLSHAPSLAGADLQRTNLRNAYLADVDMAGADLFQADLTDGSLKGATATGAFFYHARLTRCVLAGADLRDATFHECDLRDVRLHGALLTGATFVRCENVPAVLAEGLDGDGRYRGTARIEHAGTDLTGRARIFVSHPFQMSAEQVVVFGEVRSTLAALGAEVVTVDARDTSPAGVLGDIRRAMLGCSGVIVLGLRQVEIAVGRSRVGTPAEAAIEGGVLPTPWNHAEAGVAAGLGLPLLRLHEGGITGGVFDGRADPQQQLDLGAARLDEAMAELRAWAQPLCGP